MYQVPRASSVPGTAVFLYLEFVVPQHIHTERPESTVDTTTVVAANDNAGQHAWSTKHVLLASRPLNTSLHILLLCLANQKENRPAA